MHFTSVHVLLDWTPEGWKLERTVTRPCGPGRDTACYFRKGSRVWKSNSKVFTGGYEAAHNAAGKQAYDNWVHSLI